MKTIRIITISFGVAMTQLLTYCILPILICFAIMGIEIWGFFSYQYRSFEHAFISVLFFTLGQTDTANLMKINKVWTIIYMAIFFLILIYLIISMFIAIYADSYRLTILAEGYPDEKSSKSNFSWKTLLSWLIGFLPQSALKRLKLGAGQINEAEDDMSIESD